MEWHFSNDIPIYTQLVNHIKFAIVSGQMLPGSKMSSVRDLAAEASVNPNTVQRALQQLEREGLVFTQRGDGRYITEDTAMIEQAKKALANEHISQFIEAMKKLGYDLSEMIGLLESSGEVNNGDNI